MTLAEDLDWVDGELDRLRAAHEVPGVAVGVLRGDETAAWVSGVTSLDTGVEVTPDTVFQIGSNTKLYTATLAMRLVAEGRVDLDARVVDYLPDFRTAQPHLSGQVTVRQLLCHTSGIDGDFPGPSPHEFSSTMLARYVDAMSSLEMLHPPGRMFSYCNSGYVLLGRVIESVTAMPYWQALSELLTEPAALTRTHVLPQDIVPRRAAVGHLPDPGTGRLAVAPAYVTAPACAPAGSCPVACVQDVLGFVALHLDGGRARNGTQVLSADAVAAMRVPQVKVPPLGHTHAWGLGWMLGVTDDGQPWIGHTGGTLGQISFVEVLPDRRCAVVVLTNSVGGGALGLALVRRLLGSVADAVLPESPRLPSEPAQVDLGRYAGRYERRGTTVTITPVDDGLDVEIEEEPPIPAYVIPPQHTRLVAVDEQTFVSAEGATVRFLDFDDDGAPSYLFNSRLLRRRS